MTNTTNAIVVKITQLRDGISEKLVQLLDAKKLDLEYVDLHYKSPIDVNGSVEKVLNTLTVRARLAGRIEHTCARCLKSVDENVVESLDLAYEIEGRNEVDMTDDIRDVLLLAYPEKFVCRQDCKGLCSHCGVDLNIESCQCSHSNGN